MLIVLSMLLAMVAMALALHSRSAQHRGVSARWAMVFFAVLTAGFVAPWAKDETVLWRVANIPALATATEIRVTASLWASAESFERIGQAVESYARHIR